MFQVLVLALVPAVVCVPCEGDACPSDAALKCEGEVCMVQKAYHKEPLAMSSVGARIVNSTQLSKEVGARLVKILTLAEKVAEKECTGVVEGSDSVVHCEPPIKKIREKLEQGVATRDPTDGMGGALGGPGTGLLTGTTLDSLDSTDRLQILEAFSVLSMSMTPESADDTTEITTDLLNIVYATPDTQEHTPAELQSQTVQGDMVFESVQGDILLESTPQGLGSDATWTWRPVYWSDDDSADKDPTTTTIPFCFDEDMAATSKASFLAAVQHYKNYIPCLDFREVLFQDGGCAEKPAIYVTSFTSGCWSFVGMATGNSRAGMTQLNLQPFGCDTMGTAAHELGHALGMVHEQSRSDRDDYITVLEENIIETNINDYSVLMGADTELPYDYKSLMHYGDTDFAKPGYKTMFSKGDFHGRMGNRMGLTQTDAMQVAKHYRGNSITFKACSTDDPHGCTKEQCVCHPNLDEKYPYIKVHDGECFRCLRQCPNYPYGTSNVCTCPLGLTFSSFTYNGITNQYCRKLTEETPEPTEETDEPTDTEETAYRVGQYMGREECEDGYQSIGSRFECCPVGYTWIAGVEECKSAAETLGLEYRGVFKSTKYMKTCSHRKGGNHPGVWYNPVPEAKYDGHTMTGTLAPICKAR